jgi:hypothetical protein
MDELPSLYQSVSSESLATRMDRLGASFCEWRFATQGGPQGSLLEQFGWQRRPRPTDVRDPALPEPDRDEFGPGFVGTWQDCYVEYRRAYLMVGVRGPAPVVVVLRNNSRYFGWDRLPSAVSVCVGPWAAPALEAVTPTDFGIHGTFRPWDHVWAESVQTHTEDRLAGVASAMALLEELGQAFERWLLTPESGLVALVTWLIDRLAAGKPLPWMTWQTIEGEVLVRAAVNEQDLTALKAWLVHPTGTPPVAWAHPPAEGLRLVLASGPEGDRKAVPRRMATK